jgi:hypothetical protein
MAAALQNLPPELAGRVGREAMRPHPPARMMANVRRYEGMWCFVSFDGILLDYSQPYTVYAFENQTKFAQVDFDGELAFNRLSNVVFSKPVRSPDPEAAGG